MILIVDLRDEVVEGFAAQFDREGVPATGISPADLARWLDTVSKSEIEAVDAILIGDVTERASIAREVKSRIAAALIALNDQRSLEETLDLFAAGVDDVVRKPVHVREILARIAAIRRRNSKDRKETLPTNLQVFFDGRDPIVAGEVLRLPRRERRILEFLAARKERRVTKAQIFNAVYGLYNEAIDENIIESHISRLRKRLKQRLGYDPIDSQRYLGYRLACSENVVTPGCDHVAVEMLAASLADPVLAPVT